MWNILENFHSSLLGGHFGGFRMGTKVLQSRFYWPTLYKDTYDLVKLCTQFQMHGGIPRRHKIPLKLNLKIELFDVWSIDFIITFMRSYENKFIFVVFDYVSKGIEAIAWTNNERVSYSS